VLPSLAEYRGQIWVDIYSPIIHAGRKEYTGRMSMPCDAIRICLMTKEKIGLAKALGHSTGAIAQAIGRPKSTVWRELSRNRLPSGRYSPLHAAGADQLRRRRETRIERDRALRTFVVDRLAEGWTPSKFQAG